MEIADHLDERFRILTGKRRGRLERQQTLRATVDWSYQLLEPDERTVFDRLGIFSGSFDSEAAAAVVSDEVDRRVAGARGGREPRGEVDAGRRGRVLAARRATPCSRRCGCSPATSSISAMTLIDGAAVTPRTSPTIAEVVCARHAGRGGRPLDVAAARRPRQRAGSCRRGGWIATTSEDAALAVRTIVGLAWFAQSNRAISLDDMAMRAVDLVADGPPEWRSAVFALASQPRTEPGSARACPRARSRCPPGRRSSPRRSIRSCRIRTSIFVGAHGRQRRERAETLLARG